MKTAKNTVSETGPFGNVDYGVMLASYGVTQENAIRASDLGGNTFGIADTDDDSAIQVGYQMFENHPTGMSNAQYLEFVLRNGEPPTVVPAKESK